MSTKAPILLKLALRRMSSGTRNCPKPPVGPRTRTEVSAISILKLSSRWVAEIVLFR